MADQNNSNKPNQPQGQPNQGASNSQPPAGASTGATEAERVVSLKEHQAALENLGRRAGSAEKENARLREELAKRDSAPPPKAKPAAKGPRDHMIQSDEDIARAKEEAAAVIDERPIRAGHYKVAGHTSVRSLGHLFKPGDHFVGAVGDIDGLLKSGAIVEHDED